MVTSMNLRTARCQLRERGKRSLYRSLFVIICYSLIGTTKSWDIMGWYGNMDLIHFELQYMRQNRHVCSLHVSFPKKQTPSPGNTNGAARQHQLLFCGPRSVLQDASLVEPGQGLDAFAGKGLHRKMKFNGSTRNRFTHKKSQKDTKR